MHKSRLEAFSDGVIAIIITIMVLELKTPRGINFTDLLALRSVGLCYILSFIYLAIYWNNHHHTFQAVKQVNGAILWANMHLLFWLTLVPFVTAWAGENHFASVPTAAYGFILFMAAMAYYVLIQSLIAQEGPDSPLTRAIGQDFKGKTSVVLYGAALPLAFYSPHFSLFIYSVVAAVWIVPDKRIERQLSKPKHTG